MQDIQRILNEAEPDLASHLSPWVGPALAHELGKLGGVPKHLKRAVESGLFFAEDALKEDTGLFASRWQMNALQGQTRKLNQELDRLEARLSQLKTKILPNN